MRKIFKVLVRIVIILGVVLLNSCNSGNLPLKLEESDNMVLIDGERSFIIGSYHLPKTLNPYETLSENGYNYVRVPNDLLELDKALKNNLKTWMYTSVFSDDDTLIAKEKIKEVVNKFKSHKSLLFWEIEDEPAFTWNSKESRITPQQMEMAYNIIKENDKEHGVFTNHAPVNLISTLKNYNSSTDLVAVDVYPVIPKGITPSYALLSDGLQGDLLNPYLSQVGEYVDKMKGVVENSKPVFAVLQGFSWEMLKPLEKRDTNMILYPSYEESRFMVFNAIVHGVNGVLIWGTNYTPQPSKFIDDLNKVTKELSEMHSVLSAKSVQNSIAIDYHELGFSVDMGVEFLLKEVGSDIYLITVNSDKNPVKVTFSNFDRLNEVKLLKENKSINVNNGEITVSYAPFDVKIFKIN